MSPHTEVPLYKASKEDVTKGWPNAKVVDDSEVFKFLNEQVMIYTGGSGAPTESTVRKFFDKTSSDHGFFTKFCELSRLQTKLWYDYVNLQTESLRDELIATIAAQRNYQLKYDQTVNDIFDYLTSYIPGFDHEWTCKPTGAGGQDALIVVANKDQKQVVDEALGRFGYKHDKALFAVTQLDWEVTA
jgi:hypothetical protein